MYCTLLYIRMLCTEKRNVERRGTEKQIRTEQSHSHFWWARLCNLSLERARLGKMKIHTEKEKQELWSNYMCKCVSASHVAAMRVQLYDTNDNDTTVQFFVHFFPLLFFVCPFLFSLPQQQRLNWLRNSWACVCVCARASGQTSECA